MRFRFGDGAAILLLIFSPREPETFTRAWKRGPADPSLLPTGSAVLSCATPAGTSEGGCC